MIRRTIVTPIAAMALIITGATACSDDEQSDHSTAAPTTTAASTDEADSQETAPQSENPDGAPETESGPTEEPEPERDPLLELENSEGARADLLDFVCASQDSAWAASGAVENPTDRDLTYVLHVSVVESEGRSSVVRRNVVLDVPAGETVDFDEPDLISTDRDDLECFVGVTRGDSLIED